MKSGFIFHNDYLVQLDLLTDEEAGALIKALARYSDSGVSPALSGAVGMAFSFMAAQMDRESDAYIARCEKNAENGAKGGRPKKEAENPTVFEETQKTERLLEKPKKADKDNDKDKDNDEDIYKTRVRARTFTPPTLEQVKAYCLERGNKVNAQRWRDFYASKGWMVGKNKMQDWKAAVRTWEQDAQARAPDLGYQQRDYGGDLDGISKGFDD